MPGTALPSRTMPSPLEAKPDLAEQVLDALSHNDTITSALQFPTTSQAELKAALDRLRSRSMIDYEQLTQSHVVLGEEGQNICASASPEYTVWKAIRDKGKVGVKELAAVAGDAAAKFGLGGALKQDWIRKEGAYLVASKTDIQDTTKQLLETILQTKTLSDVKTLNELRKRKLVRLEKAISYTITKGPKYAKEMPIEHADLTADLLASGAWQSASFKAYNFSALGASQKPGALHPLNKVREEFREIFFNQGFVEMPTSRYVDTCFWNFDALFVPQQHPARDLQDTFFISDPPKADRPRDDPIAEAAMIAMEAGARELYSEAIPRKMTPRNYEKYWNDVRKVHKGGAFGSLGYRSEWSEEEALRLVLRTHTTAVSTWCLHRLAEDPRPARYFSIDRVFRNEAVDATHLAEFHQVEGVIADFGLTLGGLMKFLSDFFSKLGLTDLRFKPAYNPYTEPSMEIFGYHAGLGKWVEIGNSGMFRPEMLLPMGLPEGLRVYGFGLSLERPTMIRYKVSNIRELLGHKVDLQFVEEQPAVRLTKST